MCNRAVWTAPSGHRGASGVPRSSIPDMEQGDGERVRSVSVQRRPPSGMSPGAMGVGSGTAGSFHEQCAGHGRVDSADVGVCARRAGRSNFGALPTGDSAVSKELSRAVTVCGARSWCTTVIFLPGATTKEVGPNAKF